MLSIKEESIALCNIAPLAVEALYKEINLTPKPGLVDKDNNGSHRDMNYALFIESIKAIEPWFYRFELLGRQRCLDSPKEALKPIRLLGIECEKAMFFATKGVNTHKGGIFSLGLLCFSAGRLAGNKREITTTRLCEEVSLMTQDLIEQELVNNQKTTGMKTAGEQLYRDHGLLGARGEVASGFATVTDCALPNYQQQRALGYSEERALLHTLLILMARNQDTNLVSRGGIEGLHYVQTYASSLLTKTAVEGQKCIVDNADLAQMNRALVVRHLSPGGSADLVAVTWLFAQL